MMRTILCIVGDRRWRCCQKLLAAQLPQYICINNTYAIHKYVYIYVYLNYRRFRICINPLQKLKPCLYIQLVARIASGMEFDLKHNLCFLFLVINGFNELNRSSWYPDPPFSTAPHPFVTVFFPIWHFPCESLYKY